VVRGGLVVAAVLVSALALAVSMMPGGPQGDAADAGDASGRTPVADPGFPLPGPPGAPSSGEPASPEGSPDSPAPSRAPSRTTSPERSDLEPSSQGTQSSPAHGGAPGQTASAAPACEAGYEIVNEWPDGFQAIVTVTTERALDGWRVTWSFRDGQRVGQMWDAVYAQDGSRVRASAADYNKTVAAGGTISFGFLGSWRGGNSPAGDFTLNGRDCASRKTG
ncbi:cellulose-binding protein, partial [Streptomyces zinciresistens K42]